ncbi:hypothetical protein [Nonomuraea lactucae]|uniref:hypothetical protein n=1 Tax=Nonomuraea lactucae TaxID=2249762 RepID=UPI000DE32C43|nr:hypothetical protein [Nonomuraea lactucae]
MREILGGFVVIQGLGGFVAQVWFEREWGLLPRWVDWPAPAYLGIAALGALVVLWRASDAWKRG